MHGFNTYPAVVLPALYSPPMCTSTSSFVPVAPIHWIDKCKRQRGAIEWALKISSRSHMLTKKLAWLINTLGSYDYNAIQIGSTFNYTISFCLMSLWIVKKCGWKRKTSLTTFRPVEPWRNPYNTLIQEICIHGEINIAIFQLIHRLEQHKNIQLNSYNQM